MQKVLLKYFKEEVKDFLPLGEKDKEKATLRKTLIHRSNEVLTGCIFAVDTKPQDAVDIPKGKFSREVKGKRSGQVRTLQVWPS